MKISSIKLLIIITTVLLFAGAVSPAYGGDPNAPWLRLTFNLPLTNGDPNFPDEVYNKGTDPNYLGESVGVAFVDVSGTPLDGKKAIFTDPNDIVNITTGDEDDPNTNLLPPDLHLPNGLSVATWIRFEVTNTAYMMLFTTGDNSSTFHDSNTGDAIDMVLGYTTGWDDVSPLTQRALHDYGAGGSTDLLDADTWYHLVFTYRPVSGSDPNMIFNVYHDGVNKTADSPTGKLRLDGLSAKLGMIINTQGVHGSYFEGEMDQFDIFDFELSAADVLAIYNQGPSPYIAPTDCDEARAEFGGAYQLASDFNNDCTVDEEDFSDLVSQWYKCIKPGVAGCDTPWDALTGPHVH